MKRFQIWLQGKWQKPWFTDEGDKERWEKGRLENYRMTFSTASGAFVLQELMDAYYCTALESTASMEQLAFANGQRFVIQKILETIDEAEHPGKYEVKE